MVATNNKSVVSFLVRWVSDKRLQERCLELLFYQSTSAFVSSAIAGLVLIYAFWFVSNPLISLIWVGGYASIACYRTFLKFAYYRAPPKLKAKRNWFARLGISIFVTGVLWGGFILYLAAHAEGVMAAILMANLAFLLAGAVTAYAVSLPMFILFSAPVVIPAATFLLFSLDSDNSLLAAVSLGWYLFMVSAARRFGEFAMRSLGFQYENTALVAKLEEQKRRAEVMAEELLVLSNTDGLTGLYNRRYFDECLKSEIERAKRIGSTLCLVICDVDFFKMYNDKLGHPQGDECLKSVANLLMDSVRGSTDVVARYGGEEFAIILSSTDITQAKVYVERLRRSVEGVAISHPGSPVSDYLTVSMGLAEFRPEDNDISCLIERADSALYRAKEEGRNRWSE